MDFEWDEEKNRANTIKHGVSFYETQDAFFDINRVIAFDTRHSNNEEKRYFCYGKIKDKILTVRFTVRSNRIRIIGAGYWREGKTKYEQK
ncbi:MAG: BrnT family toxin [Spirochaetota bacterium]